MTPREPRRPIVLAVDDKPANLLAIEAVLGPGYDVVRANSGGEAIDLVQYRRDIDVVLMDVQMPSMDGFETAARIKQLDAARDLPIIFITAVYREDEHVKKGFDAGGVDYFSKPFDPDLLRLKVGQYAQRSILLKEREEDVRVSGELLAAAKKLTALLENVPLGVMIADLDGRICHINEAVSRILNSVEPIQSGAYGEILRWWNSGGRIIKEQGGPLWRALHDRQSSRDERIAIPCLDGSEKTILCSASPLSRIDGQTVGAVLIIQDGMEAQIAGDDLQERITQLVSLGVELEQSGTKPSDVLRARPA